MFNRTAWYAILIFSFVAFSLLSVGFVRAMQVTGNSVNSDVSNTIVSQNSKEELPQKTAVKKDPNTFNILIIGDSIAFGTGDEKGKGFATYLPNYLNSQTTKKLTLENIAINGQESTDLLEQIHNPKPKALIASSNFILISIGGNDLRKLRSRNDTLINKNEYQAVEAAYIKNLEQVLNTIRKDNPSAYIAFVGLYNPYEDTLEVSEDNELLNTWNSTTQALFTSDTRAIYIPTYDLFKYNLKKYLADDGLHPNSLGYQAISYRVSKSIESIL